MTDSTPEARLAQHGIILPTPAVPVANYVATVLTGSTLVVSGQLPLVDGKLFASGKLGEDVAVEIGVEAARYCMINVIAQVRAAIGDLSRVKRVVRLGGFISCVPAFTQHAAVMNGASDLAVMVFGDAGRHARSTVGVPSLPLDAAVEVEGLFEIG
ncbi:RidA family protein [Gluconacetobacter azotocaptans]|uniref:RidA family protein n=1 Tax=Gluconacetobacter azotocaptans TaxID=142834 RepID=A0A7W4JUW6_9PROT|nr:RidA family protein [Gluconacetobacter azotocaptans]MBB2191366.1 RidA family protein [Gluconacetobacter azotocaptans]MBM9402511.1 RidA family protein [Gluconacetobacter azotocaptans]GBQ26599.1 translation initiation inhibitor YjgF [Gluconacetobacter azotocaptans DSM 13594]